MKSTQAKYTLAKGQIGQVQDGTTTGVIPGKCLQYENVCDDSGSIPGQMFCHFTNTCLNKEPDQYVETPNYVDRFFPGTTTIKFTLNNNVETSNLNVTWSGSSGVSIGRITFTNNGDYREYSFTLSNETYYEVSGKVNLKYIDGSITKDLYTWTIN